MSFQNTKNIEETITKTYLSLNCLHQCFEVGSSCLNSPLEALSFWWSNNFSTLKNLFLRDEIHFKTCPSESKLRLTLYLKHSQIKCPVLSKAGNSLLLLIFLIAEARWIFLTVCMGKTSLINAVFTEKLYLVPDIIFFIP